MMDAYSNMSAPPRSKVRQVVRPIGRYVKFDIYGVDFTPPFKSPQDFPSPQDWLDDFLAQYGEALDAVPRPSGYMIGYCDHKGIYGYGDDCRICRDPVLTVAILGRMSGTLYIPHRRILFGSWLEKVHEKCLMLSRQYVFPERYFPQYCGGAAGVRALPTPDGRARTPAAPCAPQFGGFIETALPDNGRARTPVAPHPLLLGSHGEESEEISQEMKDLIHKIISKWPSPDRPLQGQDLGAEECLRDYGSYEKAEVALRRGIRRLMRRASIPGKKEVYRRSVREMVCETATFLPDWHDRSHETREVAFGDALIYSTTTRLKRPSSRDNRQAFVYFDVSGSVAEQVPSVAQALLPYCRGGLCTVHVFSTVVHPASARDLAARKFSSTGGTDINCVLQHVLDLPPRRRPRAVVVVTDGFTGKPDAALAERFHTAGMRLFVGLVKTAPGYNQEADLSSLADKFVKLY